MKKIVALLLASVLSIGALVPTQAALTDSKYVETKISTVNFAADSAGFTPNFVLRGSIENKTKYTMNIVSVLVNADVTVDSSNYKKELLVTPEDPGMSFTGIGGNAVPVNSEIPATVAAKKKVNFVTCDKPESPMPVSENLLSESYENTTITVTYTLSAKAKKVTKLYKKANKKSKVLVKKVKKNAKMEVLNPKASKGFIKVKVGKKTGFIQSKMIKAA